MNFFRGQEVEVACKETGFEGSYYEATIIIREVEGNKYVVKYKNLVKDDMSGPLLEIVAGDEVRSVPPQILATEFRWGDEVDAFDNDGWWVGKINDKCWNYYLVYFEASSKDVFAYSASRLRVHQDWVRGQWISSN